MVEKSFSLQADALVFDIEDSVPPPEKLAARQLVAAAIDRAPGPHFVSVRIASLSGGPLADELQLIVRPGLGGVVLPKVESAAQVQHVDQMITALEAAASLPAGAIRVLATIETSLGVLEARAIAAASPRLMGLLFGAEDLAFNLGLFSGGNSDEMLYARSAIALAAASCGIAAIDRVVTAFHDEPYLSADCRQALRLGFRGKAVIHPQQIDIVNQIFSPSPDEIAHARRVVAVYDQAAQSDVGAVSVDGKMVDLPVVEQARRLLAVVDEILKQSGDLSDG